ncbi:YbhN family protein [Blastopirellula marina]|uniref:lysylphosphatidylglycerol synthase transmembrane domain-containing protein n=1 Tax=Blastopirellula marina TaxID=124 RepID=UPI001304B1E2|nr:lysylphosphatidylglycerol synthase transmembrane domain-containing protein [Blastopirellula marina]
MSSPENLDSPDLQAAPRAKLWKSRLKRLVQVIVVGLVVWGIWHNIDKAIDQVQQQNFSFQKLRWPWIFAAGGLYLLGSLPMSLFWIRLMRAMQQKPTTWSAIRAFFIGHLGKYVPGKALVVVLRTSLVQGKELKRSVVATAVFAETLTMVSVGAVYAAVLISIWFSDRLLLLWLAIGIAVAASGVTLPPVFRKIVLMLKVSKINPEMEQNLAGLSFPVMAWGWAANLVGWTLLGSSLYAVMASIPDADPHLASFAQMFPLLAATVCLAMVAGFVTPIPGGMGVREFVIMEMMAPVFGPVVAVVSAVLLRVAWLFAELALAIILYGIPASAATAENASAEIPPAEEDPAQNPA